MSVRAAIQRHPRTAAAAATILALAGAALVYMQASAGVAASGPPRRIHATIDEGKTFFVASAEKLPPYQHEGKTALRAYVFACGDGKPFVGYVERYSDRAKELMSETWKKQRETGGPPSMNAELLEGIEVKRPGDTAWVRHADSARASAIMNVRCSGAPEKNAEMVLP